VQPRKQKQQQPSIGKQLIYRKYRIQLKGEFMAKGVQGALRPKFRDLLPASENVSGQTASKKKWPRAT
jgi:hypothetical protein